MGRHCHYRPGTVSGENKIGEIDRHFFAGHRIDCITAGKNALFFELRQITVTYLLQPHFFGKVSHSLFLAGADSKLSRQRMIRSQAHKCRPEQSVLPSCKNRDFNFVQTLDLKVDISPDTFADPVLLHGDDPLRPSPFKFFTTLEQLLGISGYLEKPLIQIFIPGLFTATPAASVLNLLIGKNRLTLFTPVDFSFFFIDQTFSQHLRKKELLPTIIIRVTGCEFAIPVVTEA